MSARATGAAAGLGASSGFDGASNRAGSLASGAGAGVSRAVLSFQRDMAQDLSRGWTLRLALKRDGGNLISRWHSERRSKTTLAQGTIRHSRTEKPPDADQIAERISRMLGVPPLVWERGH